jgi:hypothetical protein
MVSPIQCFPTLASTRSSKTIQNFDTFSAAQTNFLLLRASRAKASQATAAKSFSFEMHTRLISFSHRINIRGWRAWYKATENSRAVSAKRRFQNNPRENGRRPTSLLSRSCSRLLLTSRRGEFCDFRLELGLALKHPGYGLPRVVKPWRVFPLEFAENTQSEAAESPLSSQQTVKVPVNALPPKFVLSATFRFPNQPCGSITSV